MRTVSHVLMEIHFQFMSPIGTDGPFSLVKHEDVFTHNVESLASLRSLKIEAHEYKTLTRTPNAITGLLWLVGVPVPYPDNIPADLDQLVDGWPAIVLLS